MKDHLGRGNTYWRVLLGMLEICTQPITKEWLVTQSTFGNNGWDLSEMLESFVCTWIGDTLYNTKTQLSGGKAQAGNGLEIWRRLFQEHHGNAEILQLGGMRRLQERPKCSNHSELKAHLSAWEECLETYNVEMLSAPNAIRTML